jgi:hypothetical protein
MAMLDLVSRVHLASFVTDEILHILWFFGSIVFFT